jgi:hypothetical protein
VESFLPRQVDQIDIVVRVPPKASISDFVGTVKDVRHRAQGKRHKGKKKVTSIIFYP